MSLEYHFVGLFQFLKSRQLCNSNCLFLWTLDIFILQEEEVKVKGAKVGLTVTHESVVVVRAHFLDDRKRTDEAQVAGPRVSPWERVAAGASRELACLPQAPQPPRSSPRAAP